MGIFDGQPVSAAITNPAFINKNQNDTMPNQLGLTRPMSGASIADIQATANKLYNATGASETQTGTNYNATPATVTNGTNYQTAISTLAGKFAPASGHMHTGAQGDAPVLTTSSISNNPLVILPVASAGVIGSTGAFAWANHQHAGVHSLAASGASGMLGDILIAVTGGLSISQSNNTILIAGGGSSGGGGGGSLFWVESTNAPTTSVDSANTRIYSFSSALAQVLYAQVIVPTSYTTGKPVKLKTTFYSPDSSGTALIQCVATLIRPGTDTFNSTTNQYTSTNAAVTLGAGTVNIPQSVVCDLTNTTGQINSISIAPGNIINIKLTRGTDTGASPLNAPVFGTEITFT